MSTSYKSKLVSELQQRVGKMRLLGRVFVGWFRLLIGSRFCVLGHQRELSQVVLLSERIEHRFSMIQVV